MRGANIAGRKCAKLEKRAPIPRALASSPKTEVAFSLKISG